MTYPNDAHREMLIRRLDNRAAELVAVLDRLDTLADALGLDRVEIALADVEVRGAVRRVRDRLSV